MASEFDIVQMRVVALAEHENLLVLAPIKAALPGIRLGPDRGVNVRGIDGLGGRQQFADVPPVHANVVQRSFFRDASSIAESGLQEGDELVLRLFARSFGKFAMMNLASATNTADRQIVRRIEERSSRRLAAPSVCRAPP